MRELEKTESGTGNQSDSFVEQRFLLYKVQRKNSPRVTQCSHFHYNTLFRLYKIESPRDGRCN